MKKNQTRNGNEIVQILEDNDNYVNADIILTPPNGGMCSNEDSDGEETGFTDHLFGSLLSAQAQYREKILAYHD